MTSLEDRLRDAYLAAAEFVREDALPAHAPTRRAVSRQTASVNGARIRPARRTLGIAPIAAAASVAVIAVTVGVVAPHVLSGQRPKSAAGAHSSGTAGTNSAIPGLPEFVVVSTQTGLEVMQTGTGNVTGHVYAPAGQVFAEIAGDSSDRTFYVATEIGDTAATCRASLYRFSVSDAGQPSALEPLTGGGLAGLPTALSVSAVKLAFSITQCGDGPGTIPPSQTTGYIGIVDRFRHSLPSGPAIATITRQWTFPLSEDYPVSMSLTADGTVLAFAQFLPGGSAPVVKKLSTDAPSGTVDQASTLVGLPPDVSSLSVGAAVYACVSTDLPHGNIASQLGVYDLVTGHRTAVLHTWTGGSCSLAPNPVHGHVLVEIDSMEPHGQGPFVPVHDVSVLAVDVNTGRLTTLLKTSVVDTGSYTGTLIGW